MPKIKENYYKSGKLKARKDQRRREAIERNNKWAALSKDEKLVSLDMRKMIAKKQREYPIPFCGK